ncbi:MAG: 30S ribosomal protein S6 [Patescibacteria group bacterium]|nr:30S ribosomal protein S6 [Patescibacteria group bacterium]MDD5294354.1 30S ribosomal protein S6 [Patescibacteria group bacterium]MDD5554029.1 30S ribosomal protein S6 [Patescibacteria group bacterium]
MSKTKSSELFRYELLFIIPNKFTEEEANSVTAKVKEIIAGEGGNITFSEFWGKKQLAYPIKQNSYGYYSLLEFDLDGEKLAKINKILRMSSDVIRFQIIKKKVKTAEQLEKEKKISEKIAVKNMAKEQKAEAKETLKPAQGKEKKLDLKDLDEKLDDILNTKDLL